MVIPFLFSLMHGGVDNTQDAILFSSANTFFVSGALISVIYNKVRIQFNRVFAILALLAFLVIPPLGSNFLLLLICTVCLFFVSSKSTLSFAFLNKIGDASYSIHLIPGIRFCRFCKRWGGVVLLAEK